jgi:choline-sulfatase
LIRPRSRNRSGVAVNQRMITVLFLVIALEMACTSAAPPPLNVLLIVVDTLRPDHLGAYGHSRDTSPAIDALARRGTRFARAYSTAPWTMPSVASIMTGLYPSEHGATSVQNPLPDTVTTLAEVMKTHGYATSGVVSHNLISNEKLNFAQGFDVYFEDEARGHGHVSTPGVTKRAVERLRYHANGDAPFFLFVHYFDPHFDYQNHDQIEFAAPTHGRLTGGESYALLSGLFSRLNKGEVQFVRDLYDEEISLTDGGIGILLSELSVLGLDHRTLVVLTADHGEEFGEHGSIGHTRTLYNELLHVPLIIRAPDGAQGLVVDTPVSLVSVMPTILELAGVQEPRLDDGHRSLAAVVGGGGEPHEQTLFAEVDFIPPFGNSPAIHKKSLMRGQLKIIRDDTSRELEVYDRSSDPGEKRNLAGRHATEWVREFERHFERVGQARHETRPRQIDENELEGLEALGYIER